MEFEKKVMNEIFLDLVESVFTDSRLIPPPPLPSNPESSTDKVFILSDSMKNENLKRYEKILADFEKRKLEIEKDTSRVVIAVDDTVYKGYRISPLTLKKHYQNVELQINIAEDTVEYKIDLKPFNNNKKYLFKYLSEFPQRRDIWNTNYLFEFGGVVSFSRIYFDKDKRYGVLEGGTTYGKLNGNGWIVFIKKDSGKWIIDKIEGTWIS